MPVDQQTMRDVAAQFRSERTRNSLAPKRPTNWLHMKRLPMEGRFNLLPLRETAPGEREWALPGLVAGAVNAISAPGRSMTEPGFNPEEEAQNFALTFTGGGLLGSRMAPAPRGSVGMNAFHGSPHKFDAFDMSKIGTGEGAQAYGHGLYFAESPGVAGQYQKQLAADVFSVGDGTVFDPDTLGHLNVRAVARRGDLDAAIATARELASGSSPVASMAANDLQVLKGLQARGGISPHKGSLYHVDIPDEAVARMLDWDAPISEQPAAVQESLRKAFGDYAIKYAVGNQMKWNDFRAMFGLTDEAKLSQTLREAGIPGIRYLDAGSRGPDGGTRNIVVFDDKLPKIIKRE